MAASKLSRLWSSPSAMMLASTSLQSLVQVLILPLVLYRFNAPTVALWALFSSIVSFSSLAAGTVGVTYVRAVAFAVAGAKNLDEIAAGKKDAPGTPNLVLLGDVVSGARTSFNALAAVVVVVLGTVGTLLVTRLVTTTSAPHTGWIAWAIVVAGTAMMTHGSTYVGYLEGHNHVALVRRWDAIFALLAAATSVIVILAGGNLAMLVGSTQTWVILRVLRNRALCRRVDDRRYERLPARPGRPAQQSLWPAVWRSFLGVALVTGTNQIGGFFYAQIGEPHMVAMYLLAVRILDVVNSVARAPFSARIPAMVRHYAQGDTPGELALARAGMRGTYALLLAGLVAGAALGPTIFAAVGTSVPFPPYALWFAIGGALVLDRYGAMHLQLYSTTNQIVWHTASAGYAVLYVLVLALFASSLHIYVFPVAMVAGYAGWYSWFCARHSYRAFGLTFWRFEHGLFIPAITIAIAAFSLAWIRA